MIAYAISDPSTLRFDGRLEADLRRFASRADWLLYRDKENPRYRENARILARKIENVSPLRLLLHDDVDLAVELGVDGIHFSGRGVAGLKRAKEAGIYSVASTHTLEEALRMEKLGSDAVTLSPVFPTPGKGEACGTRYLAETVSRLRIPVIALGGILSSAHIAAVMRCGAAGFASIRYFGPKSASF